MSSVKQIDVRKVARVLRLEDLNQLYFDSPNPTVLNELALDDETQREALKSLVITTYDKTDSLSSIPSCSCGKLDRGDHEGLICYSCGTIVTTITNRSLKPDVFIKAPDGVPNLINPMIWMMLYRALDLNKGKGTNGLKWLTDRRATFGNKTRRISSFIAKFEELGLDRGYVSFIKNFDKFFAFILTNVNNHSLRQELHDMVMFNPNLIFTQYIPIPSKVAFVVESTHVGVYYDKVMDAVIESVYTAVNLSRVSDMLKIETRLSTIQELLGKYYRDLFSRTIASKQGLLRKDCYGSKTNFSFRNIITSQHDNHNYYQAQVPYCLALVALQPAVINIMCNKHGFSYKEAFDYTEEHNDDMDPFLLQLLRDFAAASNDGKGIMISLTRFPSLRRTSTQCLYVNDFTKDSTLLSVLALRGPNADNQ